MSEISTKLRIKPGGDVLILNSPEGMIDVLNLPESVSVTTFRSRGCCFDCIILFAGNQAELNLHFPEIPAQIHPGGLVWICYPKKSSGISTDLSRDKGWNIPRDRNFQMVSVVSIDRTWTATRWKRRQNAVLKEGLIFPEIDSKNRRIRPPEDFIRALKRAGLIEVFDKMSFSHQREYLEEILSSKKVRTRISRIEKTIEMLKKNK